jgi:hypothetical protein
VKQLTPKRMSLAGFLAAGFTILGGLAMSLVVVFAFSESQARDTAVVAIVFSTITLVLVQSLRGPRDPAEKKRWPLRWPFRRRRKGKARERRYWKRRTGQRHHQPFGTRQVVRPSTFVATPRKRTEPD